MPSTTQTPRPRRDLKREKVAEARRLFRMAYARQLEGQPEHARVLFEKSLRLHPTAEAHVHLAWALATDGQLEDALDHCRDAMQLEPEFPNAWNDMGAYLIEMEEPEQALFFLKRATTMRQYSTRSFPHYNLHRAYLALGDRNRAIRHLDQALEADPDFGPALSALAELMFPGQGREQGHDELEDCLRAGTPVLGLPPSHG
ncbi:MAG: tetratricopeptide repeat protein [Acidobacteriota bacterium]